jgi:hypothetical protein
MMSAPHTLKDLAKALSLANLCFIGTWTELLTLSPRLEVRYGVYSYNKYVAIVINVLLLTAVFWGAIVSIRRSGKPSLLRLGRFGLLVLLLFGLNKVIQRPLPGFSLEGIFDLLDRAELAIFATAALALCFGAIRNWRYTSTLAGSLVPFALFGKASLLAVGVMSAAVFWVVRKPGAIVKAAPVAVMALFPFSLMTLSQTSLLLTKFGEKRPAPPVSRAAAPSRRVVWLLFDEMDFRLSFSERPAALSLPEFDRLRGQAIFATNAYPPANYTLMSMPALITGRMLSAAEPVSPSKVLITYADSGETVDWGTQPNLFSRAGDAGFKSAIVGWYHPYCRIIGDSLTRCSCSDFGRITLAEAMGEQLRKLGGLLPFAAHYDLFDEKSSVKKREREGHLKDYLGILEEAKKAIADRDLNLVLVHMPVPHAPSIYNRHEKSFELEAETGYLDSLALADRAMGELRQAMESAGTWDDTTVLITADHWLRFYESGQRADTEITSKPDDRVPFLIKLAGQKETVSYAQEFNNVILHDLILEVLGTGISDPSGVIGWMDRNRSTARPLKLRATEGE